MIRFPSLFIALCLAVAFAQSPVFGQGAQTLQFVTSSYPVVYFPTGVVTGNFNSDSFLDIAAVANGDRVSVFLGNGNGGFQNHIDFPTGDTFSFSLATGDFLNRGVTDIVTANESVCGVSFLKGNGNGTFQAPITSSLGAPSFCPVALAAGNFYPNLTGNQPQLAVLYDQQLGTTGAFAIMLLDISSGTFFSNFPRIPTTDAQPGGMAVADLNGDGKPDVIVANTKSNSVSIFLLNSNGTFAPKVDYPTTTGPFSVIAVDLENRGILDLVVVNSFGNVISILRGNGDGTFQPHTDVTSGPFPGSGNGAGSIVAADFNHDGKLDLAVLGAGSNGGFLSILFGFGDATFSAPLTLPSPDNFQTNGVLVSGDFNQDSFPDLAIGVTTNINPTINVLTNAPGVSLSSSSITFPGQPVGTTSSAQPLTIENTGYPPLSISNAIISGDFAQTNNCSAGVAGGGSCTVNVTFKPTAAGSRTGTLTITDNAALSPQAVPLAGTGTVPIVNVTPTAGLSFGSQAVGVPSQRQNITVSNTGGAPLSISGIAITGTNAGDFNQMNTCGSSLAAGGSCTISVTFDPVAPGARSGSVSITDNASGSPQTVSLSGTGAAAAPAAGLSPTSLTFSSQLVSTTSAAQSVTLSNTGNAALTITGVAVNGTNASDFSQTNNCSTSLASGSRCTISVTFTPSAAGSRIASLSITDNASGSPQSVSLSGTGTGPAVGLSPTNVTFGNQLVGTTSSLQSVTLRNTGTAALSISSIGIRGANSGDFSETDTCGSSVAAGANCTISVTFKPPTGGTRNGTLSITDNANGSPQTLSLSGNATDFSLGPAPGAPTSATFPAGQSATLNLQVNSVSSFTGTVSLACTGAPAQSTCTPSASSLNLSGALPAPFTVTVTTTARGLLPPGPLRRPSPRTPQLPLPYTILALLCALASSLKALGLDRPTLGRKWATAAVFLVCLAGLMTLSGCGGGASSGPPPPGGTPAGTYTLTVTGTSQGQNRTVALTLTVN